MQFQKIIVYKTPPGGGEGSLLPAQGLLYLRTATWKKERNCPNYNENEWFQKLKKKKKKSKLCSLILKLGFSLLLLL